MKVFTLNIRKDLHGDSNMQLVFTKSAHNKTLYCEEFEDIKMLIRSRYIQKNVTMEITPILIFIYTGPFSRCVFRSHQIYKRHSQG